MNVNISSKQAEWLYAILANADEDMSLQDLSNDEFNEAIEFLDGFKITLATAANTNHDNGR